MKSLLLSGFMLLAATVALASSAAQAQDLKPLNPDTETDRIDWSQLGTKLGPMPKPAAGTRAGAVSKTLTNEYWRLLGEGYQSLGKTLGVKVAYQAAQNEGDQVGQLSIAETMIAQGVNVLLVSPQTNANLEPILGAVNEGLVARYVIKPWDRTELEETLRWALEAFVAGRQNNALQLRLVQTERLRTLGQVSAAVLHDLNQPVMAVSMSAEQLADLSKIAPTLSRLASGAEAKLSRPVWALMVKSAASAPPVIA